MYKKTLYVLFALLLAGVIFGTQSAQATGSFPNIATSVSYTFSLDMEGNGELVTIIRFSNLDDNFTWRSDTPFEIPMQITSFSKEKANLSEISYSDNYYINNSIINYTISTQNTDSTYIHEYIIEVFPQSNQQFFIPNKKIATIRTRIKINQISSTVGDHSKFILYPMPFPKNVQSLIVRVNLPNDPYYWEEILDTFPKYDYRTPFGRGESIEWSFNQNSNMINPILIDYRIHPDQTRLDLDKATMNSLEYAKKADFWGFIALVIAIISIPFSRVKGLIEKFMEWIMEKWNNHP